MTGPKAEIGLSSGLRYLPGRLGREEQENLVEIIRGVVTEAPLYVPVMPGSGRPMSVRMTNCGPLGWVTDKERGYRYQPTHPMTGKPWPNSWDFARSLARAFGLSERPRGLPRQFLC